MHEMCQEVIVRGALGDGGAHWGVGAGALVHATGV